MTNWDANDLIMVLHTWQNGDVSKIKDAIDLEETMKSINPECWLYRTSLTSSFLSRIAITKSPFSWMRV
ncbi:hypothetical protein ACEPAH_6464 [Sanghuangporus vaninii]